MFRCSNTPNTLTNAKPFRLCYIILTTSPNHYFTSVYLLHLALSDFKYLSFLVISFVISFLLRFSFFGKFLNDYALCPSFFLLLCKNSLKYNQLDSFARTFTDFIHQRLIQASNLSRHYTKNHFF